MFHCSSVANRLFQKQFSAPQNSCWSTPSASFLCSWWSYRASFHGNRGKSCGDRWQCWTPKNSTKLTSDLWLKSNISTSCFSFCVLFVQLSVELNGDAQNAQSQLKPCHNCEWFLHLNCLIVLYSFEQQLSCKEAGGFCDTLDVRAGDYHFPLPPYNSADLIRTAPGLRLQKWDILTLRPGRNGKLFYLICFMNNPYFVISTLAGTWKLKVEMVDL